MRKSSLVVALDLTAVTCGWPSPCRCSEGFGYTELESWTLDHESDAPVDILSPTPVMTDMSLSRASIRLVSRRHR